jgi:hypothetical protein
MGTMVSVKKINTCKKHPLAIEDDCQRVFCFLGDASV